MRGRHLLVSRTMEGNTRRSTGRRYPSSMSVQAMHVTHFLSLKRCPSISVVSLVAYRMSQSQSPI